MPQMSLYPSKIHNNNKSQRSCLRASRSDHEELYCSNEGLRGRSRGRLSTRFTSHLYHNYMGSSSENPANGVASAISMSLDSSPELALSESLAKGDYESETASHQAVHRNERARILLDRCPAGSRQVAVSPIGPASKGCTHIYAVQSRITRKPLQPTSKLDSRSCVSISSKLSKSDKLKKML